MPVSRIWPGMMPDTPLVSVIIPVYNVSSYLNQCLDSVLQQTYRSLEVILVNDGSTDGSGIICDEYAGKDERVHVYHTENKGLSAARNAGLDHAGGEYISFLDSDDWAELEAIEKMVDAAVTNNADIVVAGRIIEYVGKSVPATGKVVRILCSDEILNVYPQGEFGDVVWNKLYHQRCFENIRFPDGHYYEDLLITPRLMKTVAEREGAVAVLPENLFHFRVRRSSISHTRSFSNVVDYWSAHQKKYEDLMEEQFLSGCYLAVGRMWMSYAGFSREEKRKAVNVIGQMNDFSKAHYHEIMSGNNSKMVKLFCMVSQFKARPVLWISYCAGRFHQMMKSLRFKMFE